MRLKFFLVAATALACTGGADRSSIKTFYYDPAATRYNAVQGPG